MSLWLVIKWLEIVFRAALYIKYIVHRNNHIILYNIVAEKVEAWFWREGGGIHTHIIMTYGIGIHRLATRHPSTKKKSNKSNCTHYYFYYVVVKHGIESDITSRKELCIKHFAQKGKCNQVFQALSMPLTYSLSIDTM